MHILISQSNMSSIITSSSMLYLAAVYFSNINGEHTTEKISYVTEGSTGK